MTRREIIDFCLTFPAAYEDYPFDDVVDEKAWTAMRHKTNKKSFAFISERGGRLMVNLKCDPMEADLLRGVYKDVVPGFHMSRLGRDYLRVGLCMETLRERGVRLIAINDGVDTARGDDDFTPFRNIISEW